MLNVEKKKLKNVETLLIVDYVRTSIEILLNLKMEDSRSNMSNSHLKSPKSEFTNKDKS